MVAACVHVTVFFHLLTHLGKMTKYENEGAPECVKYSDMCTDGFGYNYFVNNSENVAIKENLTYTKFDNL